MIINTNNSYETYRNTTDTISKCDRNSIGVVDGIYVEMIECNGADAPSTSPPINLPQLSPTSIINI